MNNNDILQLCAHLGLVPITLKYKSKKPLVKWRHDWNHSSDELKSEDLEELPGVNFCQADYGTQ